ncbi:hypothetical protein GCM10018781_05210 [Kitasatospora indigofera]|uniref:Secreted protein n=1 Tax=Kitasatospora indigofera TaxID=67307 RepID=A0A919FC41_9ACTN|nr:hypothetical protein [Kitasatospora indigofera]GHH60468.1 hypothetical protein GCM10018781_05210 [Kitasatospora indigofera]
MTTSGSSGTRERATAQLLLLCAVLAGLFLMHGSPAAAGDCHRALGAMPGPPAVAAAAGHRHAPMTEASPATAPVTAATGVRAAEVSAPPPAAPGPHARDTLCLATKARDGAALPAPGPATGASAVVLPAVVAAGCGGSAGRSRAGPGGGRHILLRVCVART